ncbi:MAG: hypothetical protein B6D64_12990 [Bacteroidetes bacterium 4484_276]|nr:MAG: hypothetical protein B6D64_12990 [Bacteroidetes bacterium 4484_276]
MAAVVFVGGRWLTKEDPRPPTKTSRHETTTNGKPGSAAQNKKNQNSCRNLKVCIFTQIFLRWT